MRYAILSMTLLSTFGCHAASRTSSTRCMSDSQCPLDQVCSSGQCVPAPLADHLRRGVLS